MKFPVTNKRLREQTKMHSRDVSDLFRSLVQKGFPMPDGVSRWTVYRLNDADFRKKITPGLQEETPGLPVETPELPVETPELLIETPELPVETPGLNDEATKKSREWEELRIIAEGIRNRKGVPKAEVEAVIIELCREQYLTPKNLAELLDRTPNTLRREYLTIMVNAKKLSRKHAYPNHPEQAYKTV